MKVLGCIPSYWVVVAMTTGGFSVTARCPTGPISMAGSDSFQRLAEAWKTAYITHHCPDAEIIVEGGGSSVGAARVCGTRSGTEPVDIAGMARPFDEVEATTENQWQYSCQRSPRKVLQVRSSPPPASVLFLLDDTSEHIIDLMPSLLFCAIHRLRLPTKVLVFQWVTMG